MSRSGSHATREHAHVAATLFVLRYYRITVMDEGKPVDFPDSSSSTAVRDAVCVTRLMGDETRVFQIFFAL